MRRVGGRSGWSTLLWSGVVLLVLVTPASISGNLVFEMVALTLWSLLHVPLGYALIRSQGVIREDDPVRHRHRLQDDIDHYDNAMAAACAGLSTSVGTTASRWIAPLS